ncbi:MAG: ATP-binding cassette domain-containing protein [Acidobacteria bacterium]|nr:ATP-binding cassette domain-containing protein [Acidobacteriota bacterium]
MKRCFDCSFGTLREQQGYFIEFLHMETAIRMRGVTKTFGRMTAVGGLDLDVPRGGLYGFIGPNGAGKTTTIRMIMSILLPDAGEISILDRASALEAKDRIGYLPEERGLYRRMRVRAFLRYMAHLKGAGAPDLDGKISAALERVGLTGVERKRCDELSKGMSQKVQFVAATLHRPDLLILDEPFSGLDPVSMRTLRDVVLEEHARGATILLSTHVMPQAEDLCEHVVMVHQGRKVLDDDLTAIRGRHDPRSIQLEPLESDADMAGLTAVPEVEGVRPADRGAEVLLRDGADPALAMRRILEHLPAARIELKRPRLEDVFMELVAGALPAGEHDRLRAALRDGDGEAA